MPQLENPASLAFILVLVAAGLLETVRKGDRTPQIVQMVSSRRRSKSPVPCTDSSLDLLRHYKRMAVGTAEQPRRFLISANALGLRVEMDHPADAVGDVSQMAQARALVTFLDVGVRPPMLLDAVQEVAQVRPLRLRGLVRGHDAVAHVPALVVEDQVAVLAMEHDAPGGSLDASLCPDAVLPDQAGARKVIAHDHGVGRLLIVVIEVLAAAAGHAQGGIEPQQPSCHVEGMNAVVAQLPRAVVPAPVPVVMKAIGVEGPLRCWPQPQVVVDTRRRRGVLLVSDA